MGTKVGHNSGVDNPTYDTYNSSELYSDTSNVVISGLGNNEEPNDVISKIPTNAMRQMSTIAEPVSMSWHNINVFSKSTTNFSLPFKKKEKKPVVHILKNVSGQVQPGQLLAIMGASGAGKTTLINVLTQRNLSLVDLEGVVKLNGKVANVNNIIALSAYVQQDDLFIGTLTVREHLTFQTKVRMDQHLSDKVRKSRVEQILVELGLTKCAKTMIGWPGSVKGISGGEMKRLAFASELLTNPSIMFCDEPTSGLDSFMAMSVVEVLKDMAAMGRTVICTIHQPSSEVFAMFDQLLLMADGRVAYLGQLNKAVNYFSSLNMKCPINFNPADFYIHELAVIPGKETECKAKLNNICDRYIDSDYAKEAMPEPLTEKTETSQLNRSAIKLSLYKANWTSQFSALLWRSSLSVMREPMITTIRIIQTIIISLLLGFIYWRLELDQKGVMNINGAIFLLITNMNFQNAFAVINTFCVEIPIFLREHNNGMYRVDTYFISKMLAELPTFILVPALFVAIFYFMVGLHSDVSTFVMCIAICVLVANCACSFGYFVSCVSSSITMALSIGPPIMIPMLIFGGFFLNNDSVPVYFLWLKYISWFYYGNEALVINQWQNVDHIDCVNSNNTLSSRNNTGQMACMPNGKAVIENLSFNEDHLLRDCLLLLLLTIVLRLAAYLALYLKARKR